MATCSYCKGEGHYKPKCPALAYDKTRIRVIDATNASRVFDSAKNTPHWERLSDARAAVSDQLDLALGSLSDRAPACKFINEALRLLKECK